MSVSITKNIICFDDIESKDIEWIWYPYIPKGKLVLLMGDPGTGKTYLTTYISSVISNGGKFINSSEETEQGIVVLQNGEDGIGDTIKKRLEYANANLKNIVTINEEQEPLSLQKTETIKDLIEELNPKLMIFDPLTLYIGKNVEINSANEIRGILSPISRLCSDYNTTIILVMHLNKSDSKALYKGLGSIDFMAIARSALLVTTDEEQETRFITHIKSSLAKTGDNLGFNIAPEGGIEWLDSEEVKQLNNDSSLKSNTKHEKAKNFILGCIASAKKLSSTELEKLRELIDISPRVFNGARSELSKENKIYQHRKGGKTYWNINAGMLNSKLQSCNVDDKQNVDEKNK